ncbi:MAG: CD1108 family mobile element protein [Blautia massiliensis (ex Durand et al. 2017)]|uniref:C40 family peptidase n=1 Tax=Blautia massiliensis (ex Durand et al. 2017) TaxID=1737424 RepID=UPI003994AE6F
MQEHEYRARDKTVKKMSRDGLKEENLHSRKSIRVSNREADDFFCTTKGMEDFSKRRERAEDTKSAKKKLYSEKAGRTEAAKTVGQDMEESGKKQAASRKMRIPESETARWQEEIEEADSNTEERLSEYSSRMESIRGHPSGAREYAETAAWTSHSRKKQQVQSYVRRERAEKTAEEKQTAQKEKESSRFRKNQETAEQSMEGFREEIKGKTKREQLQKEQKKQAGRLSFGDESSGMIQGAGIGMAKKAVSAGTVAVSAYVHGKNHEAEQENAAVEGAHKAELLGEKTVRYAVSRSSRRLQESLHTERQAEKTAEAGRLQFEAMKKSGKEVGKHAAEVEQSKKNAILRFWQKRRYKQAYAAAKEGKKATEDTIRVTETIAVKAKKVLQEILCRNRAIFAGIGVCVLLFAVMAASLSSCSASIQGGSTTIISTTYASEDEDIYAVENAYAQLEAALNNQINSMEATHPEYEEYRYQVDEISHNPYHLISYLTVKYGDFTYAQVASEIEEIFREQYSIYTESVRETVTETKTVRVGESLGQVVASGYCNCPICCGVWSGGPTASGAMPQANHTIAVDASNPFVPLGTKIVMNGVEYVVEDTGAFDQYGVQFDVYYGDHAAASAHGHQTWEAYIADDNGSQEVEVTSTREVNRLETVLTNHNLDTVLRNRMNDEEEQRYDYYNLTYGNRDYLFDVNTLPGGGGSGGFGYEIPAEALSDEKFANMIHEAEKYLGYPYVWGGASPSTSFDCSGFVSWVINNCGNGWNVGRQTADGLRSCCAYVSPSEAKPGDLIFFQGTYNTPGASHVGIYVGDNMMIHCGNPIQYANISSAYWQEHFMAFGRIQ